MPRGDLVLFTQIIGFTHPEGLCAHVYNILNALCSCSESVAEVTRPEVTLKHTLSFNDCDSPVSLRCLPRARADL